MDLTDLGATIRAAREAAGVSQSDLARMAHCSRVTVNYAENGRVAVGADVLLRILRPLGLFISMRQTADSKRAIELLAQQASVSYRESVPSAAVTSAFATGLVDGKWIPHLATILDEASDPLLLSAIRAVADNEGISTARVWRNVNRLAADFSSPNRRWRHAI